MSIFKACDDLLLQSNGCMLLLDSFVEDLRLLILREAHFSQELNCFSIPKAFSSSLCFDKETQIRLELVLLC